MEIERKFLVDSLPPKLSDAESALIVQIYLTECGEATERRIRRVVRNGREAHFLTEKSGKGMIREENEARISRAEFEALRASAISKPVIKKRHFMPLNEELTAEIDVYEEDLSGLITVEVEFPTSEKASSFLPPTWFGAEITNNGRYKNRSLAEKGVPE